MQNYSVVKYSSNEYAIFCATSRCYVLFSSKKSILIDRCNQLNKDCYKEQLAAIPANTPNKGNIIW